MECKLNNKILCFYDYVLIASLLNDAEIIESTTQNGSYSEITETEKSTANLSERFNKHIIDLEKSKILLTLINICICNQREIIIIHNLKLWQKMLLEMFLKILLLIIGGKKFE